MKLIVMSCSGTKLRGPEPIAAIDRYDGPLWRTLRARLAESPSALAALVTGELEIMVLSARYGFIPHDLRIADYDDRLTASVAKKIEREPRFEPQQLEWRFREASSVLFVGGDLYRQTMWNASGGGLADIMRVTETDGAGIGIHRQQLGNWLRSHYSRAELAA